MLLRTHLAIALLFILLFLPNVNNKILFLAVALLAAALPDIDTGFSTIGRTYGTGILRFFVRHRGFFHSLSFCIIISFLLAFFWPVAALPFFLGYSLHLIADSFTIEGIRPFWPTKSTASWHFKTASLVETIIFVVFLVADILLIIYFFGTLLR